MIATVILGRGLTLNEAYRSTFGCFLGPIDWLLADAWRRPRSQLTFRTQTPTSKPPPRQPRTGRGHNFKIPPQGETRFVGNEILLEFGPGATAQVRNALVATLQLTELETQTFALTGRRLSRMHIDSSQSVPVTLNPSSGINLPCRAAGPTARRHKHRQFSRRRRPLAPCNMS